MVINEETRMGINDMSLNAESALMMKKQSKKTSSGSTQRTYKKDRTENSKVKLKCWTCDGPHLRRD